MSIEPACADPVEAAPADPLAPLLRADRRARIVANATVAGTLAGMTAAATIPLWSHEERLRPVLAASYNQQSVLWAWEFAPHHSWWAFGLVLLIPCLSVVVGAAVTRRRLARAAAAAPFQVPQAGSTAASTAVSRHVTAAQRRARERGRREEILTQQRHVVARSRKASVWTDLGVGFAVVVGVWFGAALAVSALGLQATQLGIWIAVASWWVTLVPVVLWEGVAVTRRALARRRTAAGALEARPEGSHHDAAATGKVSERQ